jgi:hypothetical protein
MTVVMEIKWGTETSTTTVQYNLCYEVKIDILVLKK